MIHSIDKRAIVDKLLRGYGTVIESLEAPAVCGFRSLDQGQVRSRAGQAVAREVRVIRPRNPVKFAIQTTRGFKPKDYEMIQAVVGMWRKVGIEASIETYEIAKHFELRMRHGLAPAAFYNWGNSIGDPSTSTASRCSAIRRIPHGRPKTWTR